jgi:serine protease AprX
MLMSPTLQWVRAHSNRMDRRLRAQLVSVYKLLRKTPRFLQGWVERMFISTKVFPVVIEFHDGEKAYSEGLRDVRECLSSHKRCCFHHEHPNISGCSARMSLKAIRHMMDHCQHIKAVHFDREVKTLLNVATRSVRSDVLQHNALTGQGVTIAVIDTGIYPHPDLTYKRNRIVAFKDFVAGRTNAYDDNGHGTHCAGDAAGDGIASGGIYRAPAPDANIVGVKVLDSNGSGSLSTIIAGVEWCISNQLRYGIRIISMSLGAEAIQSRVNDPLVRAVEAAWNRGMIVCVAAGNEGPYARTISSPGISPRVITVGALDDESSIKRSDDEVADFSSRGPTPEGLVKPDVLCPGVNIISLRAPNSLLDRQYKNNRVGTYYFSESGTSMATPICAGVIAQLLQAQPGLTPDQVKERLLNSADDLGLPPNVQGRGYVNAVKLLG